MGIEKNCNAVVANIGSASCASVNPFLDVVSLIFTTDDFEFATVVDGADQDKHLDAIRAKKMMPLHEVVEIDDNTEDAQYYEAPNGSRTPRRLGNYRHVYRFNKPLEVHKALQTFRNARLRVFLVDSANNIYGYSPDGTKFAGFAIGMLNPEKMKFAMQDNTPAMSPVVIDLRDAKQWNEKGVYLNPGWFLNELAAVSDVMVKVISAIATKVVLGVYYFDGYQSDGSENLIGISGIAEADFLFTTTAPTVPMVDNLDGTYDFGGVEMTSGSVTLAAPKDQVSVGDPIEAVNDAVITIA